MIRRFYQREAGVLLHGLIALHPVHDVEVAHLVRVGRAHVRGAVPRVDHRAARRHRVAAAQRQLRRGERVEHLRLLRTALADQGPGVRILNLPARHDFACD